LTEDFIAGMRNLFAEHYIDVPAEKVDLVDELAGKVEELESKLDEEIERAVELKKSLVESRKVELTRAVCEGLTDTQVEKIKSLAESVEFSTEDEYKNKLETIRENYFPSNAKKATEAQLHEEIEVEDEKKVINDPWYLRQFLKQKFNLTSNTGDKNVFVRITTKEMGRRSGSSRFSPN
jgi:hypothetical protein